MSTSILRLIGQFDDFGYRQQLTYKGSDQYQTCPGGSFSIAVRIFTFLVLVMLVANMLLMTDPEITTFSRTMGTQEREDILNSSAFSDNGFVMSAVTMLDGVPAQVPAAVGRLTAYKRTRAAGGVGQPDVYTALTLRDCSSLIDASTLEGSSDTY